MHRTLGRNFTSISKILKGKLYIWYLTFKLYVNLVTNVSNVSI